MSLNSSVSLTYFIVTDRNLRPSDSSAENDSFVFTYTHRFSKLPDDNVKDGSGPSESNISIEDACNANSKGGVVSPAKEIGPNKPPKRVSTLHLENIEERNKDTLSSDTENASPAIGPKDVSCVSFYYFLIFSSETHFESL